jgi:hypothetical protein
VTLKIKNNLSFYTGICHIREKCCMKSIPTFTYPVPGTHRIAINLRVELEIWRLQKFPLLLKGADRKEIAQWAILGKSQATVKAPGQLNI